MSDKMTLEVASAIMGTILNLDVPTSSSASSLDLPYNDLQMILQNLPQQIFVQSPFMKIPEKTFALLQQKYNSSSTATTSTTSSSLSTISILENPMMIPILSVTLMLNEEDTKRVVKDELLPKLKEMDMNTIDSTDELANQLIQIRSLYFEQRRQRWELFSMLLESIFILSPSSSSSSSSSSMKNTLMDEFVKKILRKWIENQLIQQLIHSLQQLSCWYPTIFGVERIPLFGSYDHQEAFTSNHLHAWTQEALLEIARILDTLVLLITTEEIQFTTPDLYILLSILFGSGNGYEQLATLLNDLSPSMPPSDCEKLKYLIEHINLQTMIVIGSVFGFYRSFQSREDMLCYYGKLGGTADDRKSIVSIVVKCVTSSNQNQSLFYTSSWQVFYFLACQFHELSQQAYNSTLSSVLSSISSSFTNNLTGNHWETYRDMIKSLSNDPRKELLLQHADSTVAETLYALSSSVLTRPLTGVTVSMDGNNSSVLNCQGTVGSITGNVAKTSSIVLAQCWVLQGLTDLIIRQRTLTQISTTGILSDLEVVTRMVELLYRCDERLCERLSADWDHHLKSRLSTDEVRPLIRLVTLLSGHQKNPTAANHFIRLVSSFVSGNVLTGVVLTLLCPREDLPAAEMSWWELLVSQLYNVPQSAVVDQFSPATVAQSVAASVQLGATLRLLKVLAPTQQDHMLLTHMLSSEWKRYVLTQLLTGNLQFVQHTEGVSHSVADMVSALCTCPLSLEDFASVEDHESVLLAAGIPATMIPSLVPPLRFSSSDKHSLLTVRFSTMLASALSWKLSTDISRLQRVFSPVVSPSSLLVTSMGSENIPVSENEGDDAARELLETLEAIQSLVAGDLELAGELVISLSRQFTCQIQRASNGTSEVLYQVVLMQLTSVAEQCSPDRCFQLKCAISGFATTLLLTIRCGPPHLARKLRLFTRKDAECEVRASNMSDGPAAMAALAAAESEEWVRGAENSTRGLSPEIETAVNSFVYGTITFMSKELESLNSLCDSRVCRATLRPYVESLRSLLYLLYTVINQGTRKEDTVWMEGLRHSAPMLRVLIGLGTVLPVLVLHRQVTAANEKATASNKESKDNSLSKDRHQMSVGGLRQTRLCDLLSAPDRSVASSVSSLPLPFESLLCPSPTTPSTDGPEMRALLTLLVDQLIDVSELALSSLHALLISPLLAGKSISTELAIAVTAPVSLLPSLSVSVSELSTWSSNVVSWSSGRLGGSIGNSPSVELPSTNFVALLSLLGLSHPRRECAAAALRVSAARLLCTLVTSLPGAGCVHSLMDAIGTTATGGFQALLLSRLTSRNEAKSGVVVSTAISAVERQYLWRLLALMAESHPDVMSLLLGFSATANSTNIVTPSYELRACEPSKHLLVNAINDEWRLLDSRFTDEPLTALSVISLMKQLLAKASDFPVLGCVAAHLGEQSMFWSKIIQLLVVSNRTRENSRDIRMQLKSLIDTIPRPEATVRFANCASEFDLLSALGVDQRLVNETKDRVTVACEQALVQSRCLELISMERFGAFFTLRTTASGDSGPAVAVAAEAIGRIVVEELQSINLAAHLKEWLEYYLDVYQHTSTSLSGVAVKIETLVGMPWYEFHTEADSLSARFGDRFALNTDRLVAMLHSAMPIRHLQPTESGVEAYLGYASRQYCNMMVSLSVECAVANLESSLACAELRRLSAWREFLELFVMPSSQGCQRSSSSYNAPGSMSPESVLSSRPSAFNGDRRSEETLAHVLSSLKASANTFSWSYTNLVVATERCGLLLSMLHHRLRIVEFRDRVPARCDVTSRRSDDPASMSPTAIATHIQEILQIYNTWFSNDNDVAVEVFSTGISTALNTAAEKEAAAASVAMLGIHQMSPTSMHTQYASCVNGNAVSAAELYPKKYSLPIQVLVTPVKSQTIALKLKLRMRLLTALSLLFSAVEEVTSSSTEHNEITEMENMIAATRVQTFSTVIGLQQSLLDVYGLGILVCRSQSAALAVSTSADCGVTQLEVQALISLIGQLALQTVPSSTSIGMDSSSQTSGTEMLRMLWEEAVVNLRCPEYLVQLFRELSAQLAVDHATVTASYGTAFSAEILTRISRTKRIAANATVSLPELVRLSDSWELSSKNAMANTLRSSLDLMTHLITAGLCTGTRNLGKDREEAGVWLECFLQCLIDCPLFHAWHDVLAKQSHGAVSLLMGYTSTGHESPIASLWSAALLFLERSLTAIDVIAPSLSEKRYHTLVGLILSFVERHSALLRMPLIVNPAIRFTAAQIQLTGSVFSLVEVLNDRCPLWRTTLSSLADELFVACLRFQRATARLLIAGTDHIGASASHFLLVTKNEIKSFNAMLSTKCIADKLQFDKSSSSAVKNSWFFPAALLTALLPMTTVIRQMLPVPQENFDRNAAITVGSTVYFMSTHTNDLACGVVIAVQNQTTDAPSAMSNTTFDVMLSNDLVERSITLPQIRYLTPPICEFLPVPHLAENKEASWTAPNKYGTVAEIATPSSTLGGVLPAKSNTMTNNPNEASTPTQISAILTTAHLYRLVDYILFVSTSDLLSVISHHPHDSSRSLNTEALELLAMQVAYVLVSNLDHLSFAPNFRETLMLATVDLLQERLANSVPPSSIISPTGTSAFGTTPKRAALDMNSSVVEVFSSQWTPYVVFLRGWLEEIFYRLQRSRGVSVYRPEDFVVTPIEKDRKKRIGLRAKVEWAHSADDL